MKFISPWDEHRNELKEEFKVDPSMEPVKCRFKACSKVAIVRMPDCKEDETKKVGYYYYYCEEHFDPQGECENCGVEMNEDWDIATRPCSVLCRPCGKHHDEKECDVCDEEDE